MGLITSTKSPLVAQKDIKCYKVMLRVGNNKYYVCPPATWCSKIYANREPKTYMLCHMYEANLDELGPMTQPVNKGDIGPGYIHTFVELSDAVAFTQFLKSSILNHQSPSDPKYQFYYVPKGSRLAILNATIPKGCEYWQGVYDKTTTKSYASKQIIYNNEVPSFREKTFSQSESTPWPLIGINIVQKKYNVIISKPWQKFYKSPYDTSEYNWAWDIILPDDPDHRHIRLERDSPYNQFVENPGRSWSCHFVTGLSLGREPIDSSPLSEDQKQRLFGALIELVPLGHYLCTWGGVYYGAIPAFQRLLGSGRFEVTGYRQITILPKSEPSVLPILKRIK